MVGAVRAVSVEGPEAAILAGQMNCELVGKRVAGFELGDTGRLQKTGFMNRESADYQQLVGGVVESVISRGNTVLMKLDNGVNLVISPEYGGDIFFWEDKASSPEKFHLRLDFENDGFLTVRITSMGGVTATRDQDLDRHYLIGRDFASEVLDPQDRGAGGFSRERSSEALALTTQAMKTALVGKQAVVVGISNSTFQDVLFRAGIHPKRKASDLDADERSALYDAICFVMDERRRLGGKDGWRDLYRRAGRYVPAMGPGMSGRPCSKCGGVIQKMALGGGDVNICPVCQR